MKGRGNMSGMQAYYMLDILIVEDNKEIGNLLSDFLRKENYTVIVLYLSNFTTDILGMHWRMMNF